MDIETWKSIWHVVLISSSALFYAVVIAVGIKGMGDVKEMLAQMIANRDRDE
jgi:hypothetical protein